MAKSLFEELGGIYERQGDRGEKLCRFSFENHLNLIVIFFRIY